MGAICRCIVIYCRCIVYNYYRTIKRSASNHQKGVQDIGYVRYWNKYGHKIHWIKPLSLPNVSVVNLTRKMKLHRSCLVFYLCLRRLGYGPMNR